MSSQTEVSVCNLSLLAIGARAQVSSISPSDGSTAADACSTLYTYVFEQLARAAKWGCLKKQITLTLIQAAEGTPENPDGTSLPIPQQPWLYAYLIPPDSLFIRQILCPNTPSSTNSTPQLSVPNGIAPWLPSQGMIPYEIGYTTDSNGDPLAVILTNQENALCNYTVNQPNPQSWDSMFTAAYVASLAAYLVPALSLQPNLMQMQIQIADRMIAKATAMDGNENPVSQDHVPDFIRARQGATGSIAYAPRLNAYGFIGFMVWPG